MPKVYTFDLGILNYIEFSSINLFISSNKYNSKLYNLEILTKENFDVFNSTSIKMILVEMIDYCYLIITNGEKYRFIELRISDINNFMRELELGYIAAI